MTTRYIALLAAVNVGGRRTVTMARLRAVVEAAGYERVATYIQSGNLFFDAPVDEDHARIKATIEAAIAAGVGFEVVTVLLAVEDFAAILDRAPFSDRRLGGADGQLIHFLLAPTSSTPSLPLEAPNGSFRVVGADRDAWYVDIFDRAVWAHTSTTQLKRMGVELRSTGRWRHTSVKILDAAGR